MTRLIGETIKGRAAHYAEIDGVELIGAMEM